MDPAQLLKDYGLPGLVIAGLLWDRAQLLKRINDLTDMTIKREGDTLVTLKDVVATAAQWRERGR